MTTLIVKDKYKFELGRYGLEDETMGRQKDVMDPKFARQIKKAEEKRARAALKAVVLSATTRYTRESPRVLSGCTQGFAD